MLRGSRPGLTLVLGTWLAGCTSFCCEYATGVWWASEASCEADGGVRTDDFVCEVQGDPDAVPTPGDPVNEGLVTCAAFCEALQAACPSDTACVHSCETSTTPPDDEALTCAQAATDCPTTNPCWDFQTFE